MQSRSAVSSAPVLPLILTAQLLKRFWPQLFAIAALAIIVVNLLLIAAARVALIEPIAGLMLLTLVVLAQLVATVAMFLVLRPGLPSIGLAQSEARIDAASGTTPGSSLATLIGAALLPFFLYYAAWGFLGDIIRRYSRLALEMAPFGRSGNVLDILDSRWLLVAIAVSWLLRAVAKWRLKKQHNGFLAILVIICETSWIFIGLYVHSRWKDSIFAWIGNGGIWTLFDALAAATVAAAHAAAMVPVEYLPRVPSDVLLSLFWYMTLPVIWLVLAAIIYGHDIRDPKAMVSGRAQSWVRRYQSLPGFLLNFIDSFVSGYRSRYLPVANAVRLAFRSRLILLAVLIVGYRMIDWASAWLWLGSVRMIGQQQPYWWSILPDAISFFLGSQYRDTTLGILIEPLRIVFLAAVLEAVFRLGANDTRASA